MADRLDAVKFTADVLTRKDLRPGLDTALDDLKDIVRFEHG